jgi:hypothetical protein
MCCFSALQVCVNHTSASQHKSAINQGGEQWVNNQKATSKQRLYYPLFNGYKNG